mgnify:FL=1
MIMDPFGIFIWIFATGVNLLAAYAEHKRGDKWGRNFSLSIGALSFIIGLTFLS